MIDTIISHVREVLHNTSLTQVFSTAPTQPVLYFLMQYLVEGPALPFASLLPHSWAHAVICQPAAGDEGRASALVS